MGNAKGKLETAAGVPYVEQENLRHPMLKNLGFVTLILSIITVFLTWSTGLYEIGVISFPLAIYLLVLAVPLTLCELSWLITKCPCCGQEGPCGKVLTLITVLQGFKRGLAYIAAALIMFLISAFLLQPWGIILALLWIALGICYILKKFQFKTEPVFSNEAVAGAAAGVAAQQFQTPAMQDPAVVAGVTTGVMAGVQAHQQMQQNQGGYGGANQYPAGGGVGVPGGDGRGGYGKLP